MTPPQPEFLYRNSVTGKNSVHNFIRIFAVIRLFKMSNFMEYDITEKMLWKHNSKIINSNPSVA